MRIIRESKIKRQAIGFAVFVLFGFFASGFFLNLKMNFTSQAPEGNWNEPWYNDCEEASIVIVDSFYNNRALTNVIAKKEILRIFAIKEKAYGLSFDEGAEKIVSLINNFLNWKARIVENPTIEQIKDEIENNRPVILPTDGRKLNNRYFTTSHYHVFVISGYDDDKKMFIVQEPGTYRGHNYQYSYATVEKAMRDYNSVDLSKGRRVAIFTGLEIKKTGNNVGNKNELNKTDKLDVKTTPAPADVNSDNGSSGEEAKKSYPPTVSEKNNEGIGLVKTMGDYWAYLIDWIRNITS